MGADLDSSSSPGLFSNPGKSQPGTGIFFMWGFLRQNCCGTHCLCVPHRQWLLQLVYLLVFGSPVTAYLNLQSKPEDRDEKMASKVQQQWLVLFRGGYLWSHRPACLPPSHQRSIDPVCAARPHRESRHPSFFKDPSDQTSPDTTHLLTFEVAGGLEWFSLFLYLFFLALCLDNIVMLFDRWEKKPQYLHIKVNILWWSRHSPSSFSLSTSSEMCFRHSQEMKEQVLSSDSSRWEDLCRRVCASSYMLIIVPAVSVSLAQALGSHRVYLLTARIPAKVRMAFHIWSVVRWT